MAGITTQLMRRLAVFTNSPGETKDLGERLGRLLAAGSVVALEGPLGAGKTTLIQGIGRGLGIKDPITSPTFTLAATYQGEKLKLYHLDLYRISDPREFTYAGLEDLVWGDGICVVEWADKVENLLPDERLWIIIKFGEGDEREIELQSQGSRYDYVLQNLADHFQLTYPRGN